MTDSKSSIIHNASGVYLRPTAATPPLGVQIHKPDPPNLPEQPTRLRRLPLQPKDWQPVI